MNQLFHILKYKAIAFLRLESKFNLSSLLKNMGSGIIYFGFAIGAFLFSKKLIWFLIEEIKIGQFLLHEFISMILFIFFISINIGNLIVSYSTLYKSTEITFLFTKPIDHIKIFAIKFFDNFFYSSSTLLMVLLSMLAGYAYYFKLSFASFILLMLNFLPFMISAGSIAVIILLLIIKVAHKLGIRKTFYTLAIGYVSFVLFFFNVNSPKHLVTMVMKYYPLLDKNRYLDELISPIVKFFPNNWLSQTAYSLINGNFDTALFYTTIQIIFALISLSAALYLGKLFYFQTWLLNFNLTSSLRANIKDDNAFNSQSWFIKPSIYSIIKKDILLFKRDTTQVVHALVLLFLLIIFIMSVAGIRYVGLGNFYLQTIIYLSIFVFNLLLISTLALRFIFPLISLEGESFWKLKSSPVNATQLIKSKLIVNGSIIMFVSLALSVFSNIKFSYILILFSLIATLVSAITIISINFGMGALFANYKEKNPIRIASSQGASICFLINILYILFLVLILFKPFSSLFLSIMLNKVYNLKNILFSLLPLVTVSLLIVFLNIRTTYKALRKDI